MGTEESAPKSIAGARWPYASLIALATLAMAWPAAGYGAVVIWVAGDFLTTGTQWIFRWTFLAELLAATTLHLLAVGCGARFGIPPLIRDLAALDATVSRRERLAASDPGTLRAALRAVTRFPVWNGWIGIVLSLLVTAACVTLECVTAGVHSPNVWVIVRGGLYATTLYGAASLALGELLTRPACRALRSAAATNGIDPYDGFVLASGWRIVAMVLPAITGLLVAAEIGLSPYGRGAAPYAALIGLSAVVVVALNWLQYENSRSAVRELGWACRELAAGRAVDLVTGSTEPLLIETAVQFSAAARRIEEEAEIAAALLGVAQTVNAHLGRADMLEEVARLAVEALDCDWGSIYVWDEKREAFRLRANTGARPEMRAEVEQINFTADNFPIVRAARPGELLELPDSATQTLVPPALLQRWEIASMLAAPICRGNEVAGSLLVGYRRRTGAFSAKQRRLALGIAHTAAVALENTRLIADLEAASRLKSEFVSTMSHELRSPLNVILGFADMARDADTTPPERQEHLERIEAAARELLTLIESTLEVGKLEAGREDIRLEEVCLPAFWAELRHGCTALPHQRDVVLEWGRSVPDLSFVTDPRKLTIVMRNLVGNALKFTERGHVRVDARLSADCVVLEVTDTGIGIRREDQDTIFEMFRQADGSDSRRFGGTGLGLYIVRRFVEQLGGSVHLESAPGRGSTFTIALPVSRTARPLRDAA